MISGSVRLSDSGLKIDVDPAAADLHPRRRQLFVVCRELYAPADGARWPEDDEHPPILATVGATRVVANGQLPYQVQAVAALGKPPILIPEEAVGEGAAPPRSRLLSSRFRTAEERRSTRRLAAGGSASAVALVLLVMAVAGFASASQNAAVAVRENEQTRAAAGQAATVATAVAHEQAEADALALEVPLPGPEVLSAAVALSQPGDAIHQFSRRGTRFSFSGTFAAAEELASRLGSLPGLTGVTVTTSRAESGAQSIISGRLGE